MQYLAQVPTVFPQREMWRDLKENEITVSKSIDDFSEKKPRTRIQLSNEILEEFEK